ncbi:chromate transporter-domain-containing protein [Cercophora scortea]|uniref:Chromate transporter-domain-containing protein n=1 Tax=Cercophora scortea TaxID=314031 RepID=A0AAE0IN63_9PEZI|nr:chromate transporter-domain-containing protein [Cercophora scortea]
MAIAASPGSDLSRKARVVAHRAWNVLRANWYLGFTSFGGPPVHFKIFNDKFVQKSKWIDEQLYQELFSISQALSGPASTKMLYCINLIQDGVLAAVFSFLVWSLPGAIGMFGLSIGVSNINETLPRPVYALLSGLNAATVGVIALAAVELSHKAITDKLTRILVFLGATAGMLYNALWYFPLLMFLAGIATLVFDYRWLHRPVAAANRAIVYLQWWKRSPPHPAQAQAAEDNTTPVPARSQPDDIELNTIAPAGQSNNQRSDLPLTEQDAKTPTSPRRSATTETEPRIVPRELRLDISWQAGTAIIGCFFLSFIVIMVLRSSAVLPASPLLYRLFANMYLAGTIIFGGGPVVVPLLREYVVAEGWVSPRDFLIGLALIQAFPGPNFNFAVFLGSLTAIKFGYSAVAGALIAWVGIFFPGLIMVHGTLGIWGAARSRRWVKAVLRGVNAGAVGLIYTAVYRIWNVGYIDEGFEFGRSLGDDPWWVVVTATSFVGGRWFGFNAPVAILLGAVMGLVRYGVVSG